jgi:DNA-binding Lrp family transcriptional regulator
MRNDHLDATDARLLLAMTADPRSTTLALAEATGLSRNTVQSRLNRLTAIDALDSLDTRVDPARLGYPLLAFITVRVTQRMLAEVSAAFAEIPEVVEVFGLSGGDDLLVRVVARDADDLYRIAGQVLATSGVERTETALAMRRLVPARLTPLLERLAEGN